MVMKKVRYVAGAFGLLPATGLVAPAATAATTHPSAVGKAVRLLDRAASPQGCDSSHTHTSSAGMRGYISYLSSNGCIGLVQGHRYHSDNTGRQMRVRFYRGDTLKSTYFRNGDISILNNSITFTFSSFSLNSLGVGPHVSMVCEAIVNKANHALLFAGPVCQHTEFF